MAAPPGAAVVATDSGGGVVPTMFAAGSRMGVCGSVVDPLIPVLGGGVVSIGRGVSTPLRVSLTGNPFPSAGCSVPDCPAGVAPVRSLPVTSGVGGGGGVKSLVFSVRVPPPVATLLGGAAPPNHPRSWGKNKTAAATNSSAARPMMADRYRAQPDGRK
jgi:hypothetical protein